MLNIFQQIEIRKLFDLDRLFKITPEISGLYVYLLIIYGLLFLGAVGIGVYSRRSSDEFKRKVYGKIIYLLLFISLTGSALVFFRWQAIPYLASRVINLAVWVVALFWLASIVIFSLFTIPKLRKQKYKREQFEKYLPRVKSRGLPRQKQVQA